MKTTVVHCKEEEFDIYIGRAMPGLPASKWGNPYQMGRDGTRDEVCDKHEQDLINNPELFSEITELRGSVLGCWCKSRRTPKNRCHGDTYVKYLLMIYPEDLVEHLEEPESTADSATQLSLF